MDIDEVYLQYVTGVRKTLFVQKHLTHDISDSWDEIQSEDRERDEPISFPGKVDPEPSKH